MTALWHAGIAGTIAALILAASWAWTRARARPGTLDCLDCGHKHPFTAQNETQFWDTAKRLAVHHTMEHRTGLTQPRISHEQTPTMAITRPVKHGIPPRKDQP